MNIAIVGATEIKIHNRKKSSFNCLSTGSEKTTFGDWGPDYFIFRDEEKFPNLIGKKGRAKIKLLQTNKDAVFLKAFGI